MESITWKIGDVKITSVVEIEAGKVIQGTIPSATPENISKITWLRPHFADGSGNLKALVQSFVIEAPSGTVLVDTCVGNKKERKDIPEWGNLQTDFLSRLEEQGYKRDGIDVVLCSHLHFDHVGWNTILENGKWVPTFPNARYLFVEEEFNYWKNHPKSEIEDDRRGFTDSVLPVFEAGLIDLISTNHKISKEISLVPTQGHTPAHVSILIESGGEKALITGDVLHHPCQTAHSDWETISDTDTKQANLSRKELLEQFADTKTLIIGTHFASPTAGYVRREKDGFRLVV